MALNRKFPLRYIDREDIVPLTEIAAKTTGLSTYDELLNIPLKSLISVFQFFLMVYRPQSKA